MQFSWRPSGLAWCKRGTSSPAGILGGFVERLGHALADGVAHTRNREEVNRLLDAAPVFLRHEDGVATLARNLDGFMGIGGLVKELVELGAGLGDGN